MLLISWASSQWTHSPENLAPAPLCHHLVRLLNQVSRLPLLSTSWASSRWIQYVKRVVLCLVSSVPPQEPVMKSAVTVTEEPAAEHQGTLSRGSSTNPSVPPSCQATKLGLAPSAALDKLGFEPVDMVCRVEFSFAVSSHWFYQLPYTLSPTPGPSHAPPGILTALNSANSSGAVVSEKGSCHDRDIRSPCTLLSDHVHAFAVCL